MLSTTQKHGQSCKGLTPLATSVSVRVWCRSFLPLILPVVFVIYRLQCAGCPKVAVRKLIFFREHSGKAMMRSYGTARKGCFDRSTL